MTNSKLIHTHYRKVDLAGRGWTRPMTDKYLGEPDTTSPWTYNAICWYEKGRVEEAEQLPEVAEYLEKARQRRAAWAAKEPERQQQRVEMARAEREKEKRLRAEERKKQREDALVVEESVSQQICIQVIEKQELDQRSAKVFRSIACEDTRFVEFIRQKLSNYEILLKEYDVDQHYWRYGVIKRLVLKAIGQSYPWLATECDKRVYDIERSTKGWVWHRAYY